MAVTISKPTDSLEGIIAGVGKIQAYELTPDASWLAAGEALDFTADFSEIYAILLGGSESINGYKVDFIVPAVGTAITASNVLVTAHRSAGAAAIMAAVPDTTDISTELAGLRCVVIGKPATN